VNHPDTIRPLDDLPDADLANAMALLWAFRVGIAPRFYVANTPSGDVLANLRSAGLVRVRNAGRVDGTQILEVVR
jgi:hypothetical protein